MARLDNPAGRLHALLSRYRTIANEDRTIHLTWAEVLEVDQRDVPVALAGVASLITSIEAAVSRAGDEDQLELFRHYGSTWGTSVMAPHHLATQTPSPGKDLIDQGALAALGGLSAFLSATQSEGTIPGDERLKNLRAQVQEAVDGLADAEDVPFDLRRLILDRLHDVLWALDRLRTGGPGAVQAAAERLFVSVATSPQEARRASGVQKALTVAGVVWAAFVSGPAIQSSITAWTKLVELGPGLGG